MQRENRAAIAVFIAFCFLISPLTSIVYANQENPLTSTIHSNWLGDENHSYLIKFNRVPTAEELGQIVVTSEHLIFNEGTEFYDYFWGEGLGIVEINEYSITLNDNISYGDQVDINVYVNDTIIASRLFKPVIWTQPLADHEVTLSTHWELDQTESSSQGEDNYVLIFEGQGWQKRIGTILEANELGNGSLLLNESTNSGNVLFNLNLDSVWRNETTINGILTDSEF